MKRGKTITPILVGLAAIGIGLAVVLNWFGDSHPQIACTEEAKVCPDGSAVGRTGPNCQFAPCPSPSATAFRNVSLWFYSPELDRDESGNFMCSAEELLPLPRTIPLTNTPIHDTIRLLLESKPTAQESGQGIVSEFPLEGVKLKSASLTNGVLTLMFEDPDHRTGGGSCFVTILRAQVEGTAKQFPEVREVRLMPTDLFQP